MTQREALSCLLIALAMVTTGLVWLFGPWALVGVGASLGVAMLFVVDLTPGKGSE